MHSPTLYLLAAGVSSRMKKPLPEGAESVDPKLLAEADSLPKCMLSVGTDGHRFVDYLLANAYAAGYREIVLVLHQDDVLVEAHVRAEAARSGYEHLRIRIARQYLAEGREKPWGTGDAVAQAVAQCPPVGESFTLSNSDNLCGIQALRAAFEAEGNMLLPYDPVAMGLPPEGRSRYALVSITPE